MTSDAEFTGITRLARALIADGDLDDLLSEVGLAASQALGFATPGHVVVHAPDSVPVSTAAGDPDVKLRLPLCSGTTRFGYLEFDVGRGDLPDDWDAERAGQITSLIADGLIRRQATNDEQERLRSEATQLKFDLIAVLSHELRTPLTAIKGYASTLLLEGTDWDDAMRTELLRVIEEESDRMTNLVTDILDSAVIEAGELRIQPEPVLLRHVTRHVVETMARRSPDHHIVLSFPEDFPIVEVDVRRIEQVLTNLLDNAIKYSPDGRLIVVRGEVPPGTGEVLISVSDEGIGIAPEHLNKLFERFFRARPEGRTAVRGTGLGLPLCDAIVRAHGGRIWAESTLGRGTTLAFTLPIQSRADVMTPEESDGERDAESDDPAG